MLKKFFVFCLVGATAAFVDLGIFNLLFYFEVYFVLCRVLAICTAWAYVFIVNRNFTFNSRENIVNKQILKFFMVYSIAMFVSVAVSYLVLIILGQNIINGNVASVVGIIVGIPITFFGSIFWIFKKDVNDLFKKNI
jgi:putative flippase GtrA